MQLDTKTILLILGSIILGIITVILLKNKKIKIVFNVLVYIIYLFIIVISVQKVLYQDNRILNLYLFRISSGSMRNTLEVEDYILVKKEKNYEVGDIITYQLENRTITHRIVEMDNNMITTKGDANFTTDQPIQKNKVIGKTIYHGKFLNDFVNYYSYMIIAYATSYLVSGLFIKKNKK